MDIGYLWDSEKYEAVRQKHCVEFQEVVSALSDKVGFDVKDSSHYADRWLWIGRTYENRVLIVVFSDEELPIYRIITAYDAEGRYLHEYNQRRV